MQHLLVPVYYFLLFNLAQDVVIHMFHYFLTLDGLNDQITEKLIFRLIDDENNS